METTTALLLGEDLALTVGTRELPVVGDRDVLIDVQWAGICGSDLHVLRSGDWVAYWPATLGHEVVGRVRTSRHPDLEPGDRVVADSRIPTQMVDGQWRSDRLAKDMQWLGEARPGGFAHAMVLPGDSVFRVPGHLDSVDAVLAEPLAVVMCAVDQVAVEAPAGVLVLGYGPIGALAHADMSRRWPQARFTVVEPNAQRAALAHVQGARVVTSVGDDVFEVVVDAAGYPGSLTAAVEAADHGAAVLLIALAHAPSTLLPSTIVERSLRIVGSVGFDDHHVTDALTALADDPGRFNPIVSHRLELAEVPAFLAAGGIREANKVLIRCAP